MTLTIVTAHWNEDLDWLKNSKFPVVLIDKEGSAPSSLKPDWVIKNKGMSVSTIFWYIIKNYDSLPDHMAFIHGHEHAWHQMHDRPLFEVIEKANITKYNYIPLNNFMRRYCFYNETSNVPGIPGLMLKDHWLKLGFPPLPDYYPINVPPSVQFIVSKKAVLNIPKAKYEEWLALMMESDATQDFLWTVNFEFLLHFIFGEKLDMDEQTDWFSFPYKTKWWHEMPNLSMPSSAEKTSEGPSWKDTYDLK